MTYLEAEQKEKRERAELEAVEESGILGQTYIGLKIWVEIQSRVKI